MNAPTPAISIPYHAQETRWTCGAASLRMVYASLGLELSEQEIWQSLRPNPLDRQGVHTARLAWDAQHRGFLAIALQAERPWDLLSVCVQSEARVIFQHPLKTGSPQRHFSTLAALDEQGVTLHDPLHGAHLRMSREDWLELWNADFGNLHANPHEMLVIAHNPGVTASAPVGSYHCSRCEHPIPEAPPCRVCREPILLRPANLLGCTRFECAERLWARIFCPACSALLLPFTLAQSSSSLSETEKEALAMADGDPFLNLNAAMADYQKRYARLRNASSQESVRDVIGKLHDSMKVATEGLKDSLERLQSQNQERTKRIEERQAKAAKDLEAAIKTRDEALAKRAAKLAARKAREQPRPEPEDPELGARLRDKLLEEFGTRVDPPTPPSTGSSGSLIDYDPRSSQ